MSYTFLFSIFALIFLALKIPFSAADTRDQNRRHDLVLSYCLKSAKPSLPKATESDLQGLIPRCLLTEFSQQEGIGWQMKYLPRRSLAGEGPPCSVVKDNVSIQRLSHSRNIDWGGWEDCERHRPSQRLSLELWSSEALGANSPCSLRWLWKLLSEGCFRLAPTGIKFNPSWMQRGEHSFCLAFGG